MSDVIQLIAVRAKWFREDAARHSATGNLASAARCGYQAEGFEDLVKYLHDRMDA